MIAFRRTAAVAVATALLAAAARSVPASGAAPDYLRIVGEVGGRAAALAVDGERAYVGVGRRLEVLDVSDPANPRRLGATVLADPPVSIEVAGSHALVGTLGSGGLRVVDVADPMAPREVAAIADRFLPYGAVADIEVSGDRAYLIGWNGAGLAYASRLVIVDISRPAAPAVVADAVLPESWGYASAVTVRGGSAFVAAGYDGLRVIDVSDPDRPRQVASIAGEGYATDIALHADLAIQVEDGHPRVSPAFRVIEGARRGLRVFDVGRPDRPREIGFVETERQVVDLAGDGALLFASTLPDEAGGKGRLAVLRFAASGTLEPVAGADAEWAGGRIEARRDVLFALPTDGFWAVAVPDPTAPFVLGRRDLPTLSEVMDVAGHGASALLVEADGRLRRLRVAADGLPSLGPPIALDVSPRRLAAEGDLVAVAGTEGEIVLVSAGDAPLHVLGRLLGPPGVEARAIALHGGRAFLALRDAAGSGTDAGWLRSVDVSDPGAPREADMVRADEGVSDLAMVSGYLVAIGPTRVAAYRVDDDGRLEAVSALDTSLADVCAGGAAVGCRADASSAGSRLHVALSSCDPIATCKGGLETFAIDAAGRLAAQAFVPGAAEEGVGPPYVPVAIAGGPGVLFTAERRTAYKHYGNPGRLRALDLSIPAQPSNLGTFDRRSLALARALTTAGPYVLAADAEGVLVARAGSRIGGRATDHNGVGLSGVTVSIEPDAVDVATGSDGSFAFDRLPSGSVTIRAEREGWVFQPPAWEASIPPDIGGVPFTALAAPRRVTLSAGDGVTATLVYTDPQGASTGLAFPAGAVTTSLEVEVRPEIPAHPPAGRAFAGHAFSLLAYRDGRRVEPGVEFGAAVSVTIRYTAADVRLLRPGAEPELGRSIEGAWTAAGADCPGAGPARVDGTRRVVTAALCRTGAYGLFGPTRQLFLPLAGRREPARLRPGVGTPAHGVLACR